MVDRATRALEMAGTTTNPGRAFVAQIMRYLSDHEDGLRIDRESVRAQEIRNTQEYGSVRVTLSAFLGKAEVRIQVDVGFGDAITPAPTTSEFPTLLALPAPVLRTYPIETVLAEKFEAITRLGRINSRMKTLATCSLCHVGAASMDRS
jgi:hypothetical protein